MPGKLELGYAGAYDGAKENEPRVDLLGYVMGCVGHGGARKSGPRLCHLDTEGARKSGPRVCHGMCWSTGLDVDLGYVTWLIGMPVIQRLTAITRGRRGPAKVDVCQGMCRSKGATESMPRKTWT